MPRMATAYCAVFQFRAGRDHEASRHVSPGTVNGLDAAAGRELAATPAASGESAALSSVPSGHGGIYGDVRNN
jgi:hypothetical protein